jgi:hypothetical protein
VAYTVSSPDRTSVTPRGGGPPDQNPNPSPERNRKTGSSRYLQMLQLLGPLATKVRHFSTAVAAVVAVLLTYLTARVTAFIARRGFRLFRRGAAKAFAASKGQSLSKANPSLTSQWRPKIGLSGYRYWLGLRLFLRHRWVRLHARLSYQAAKWLNPGQKDLVKDQYRIAKAVHKQLRRSGREEMRAAAWAARRTADRRRAQTTIRDSFSREHRILKDPDAKSLRQKGQTVLDLPHAIKAHLGSGQTPIGVYRLFGMVPRAGSVEKQRVKAARSVGL